MFSLFATPPTLPPAEANLWRYEYSPKDDAFFRYVSRLTSDVTAQHKANRIKKRKLRALRAEVRRLRKALKAERTLNETLGEF
jgi:hypothetical protein